MASINRQYKTWDDLEEYIARKKLYNHRVWDGHRLGQLIIILGIKETIFEKSGDLEVSTISDNYRKLDDYQKAIYSEYVTVYQVLHLTQKDKALNDKLFSHGVYVLSNAGKQISLYGSIATGAESQEKKGDMIAEFCQDPESLKEDTQAAKRDIIDALKRFQGVNAVYAGLAATYAESIRFFIKDPSFEWLHKYEWQRAFICDNKKVYYNISDPGKTILPEITMEDFKTSTRAKMRAKASIKQNAFSNAAKPLLLAYTNYIIDILCEED